MERIIVAKGRGSENWQKELSNDPIDRIWRLLASLWWKPEKRDNSPENIEFVITSIDDIIQGFSEKTLSNRSEMSIAEALRNGSKVDICFEFCKTGERCGNVFISTGYETLCLKCSGERSNNKWTSE
ncbi:MAG: hypothetical protein HZA34_00260 [Candidatus Pacebacteria bacterium]|nr:hypothetical protein [Candidatus Paceibacterota bacterium]